MSTILELPLTIEPARRTLLEPLRARIVYLEQILAARVETLREVRDGHCRTIDLVESLLPRDGHNYLFRLRNAADACRRESRLAERRDAHVGYDTWYSTALDRWIAALDDTAGTLEHLRDAWTELSDAEREAAKVA